MARMGDTKIRKRVEKLRRDLDRHNHLYYVEAKPEVTDLEYDRLMRELIDLETANPELLTPNSPSQRVGGDVQAALKPVRHAVPMMSIDNTYSEAEVRAFDERVRKGLGGEQPAYVLEPKIDGASVSLRYEEGRLVLAATRGRGNTGDDITVNARTIKSVPLTLRTEGAALAPPPVVEVRGEVYMDNDDFQRVNKELEAAGEEQYMNPRNLTAGTLRRLDPKIVAKRRLRFLTHGLGQVEPLPVATYWEWTQLLRQWGLPLPKEVWRVADIEGAIRCIHEFEKLRPRLPYMTDGMVMKVDDFAQRERLGATSKAPRWVMAYKYETEQQPTVLKECRWQVGKSGKLTPVADVEPVFIGGVTVTHATLHNIDQIHRLDAHLGDTIVIERSGEVIPYVVEVVKDKRPKGAKPIEPPKACPVCGTKVEREALPEEVAVYRCANTKCERHYKRKKVRAAKLPEKCPICGEEVEILDSGIEILCPNLECPAQLKERLRWYCARTQMDITGLGEKIIDQLVDQRVLRTYGDIYRLRVDQIAGLVHETEIGEKSAVKIVQAIGAVEPRANSLPLPLGLATSDGPSGLKAQIRWLAESDQLNIKGLGTRTIDQLVDHGFVKSPSDLFRIQAAQLASLPREVKVGEKTAEKIVTAIEASRSRGLARVLAGLGIPLVGTTVARNVAEWAGSIDRLKDATEGELHRAIRGAEDEEEGAKALNALAAQFHGAFEDASPAAKDDMRKADIDDFPAAIVRLAKSARISGRMTERRARLLSLAFPTGEALLEATPEEIGDALESERVIAKSLYTFLHSVDGEHAIGELRSLGVSLEEVRLARSTSSAVSGKAVVITGSFVRFSRDELRKRLLRLGAKVTDTISSKTDILLKGTDAGSKLDKALALGTVEIWDEDETIRRVPDVLLK